MVSSNTQSSIPFRRNLLRVRGARRSLLYCGFGILSLVVGTCPGKGGGVDPWVLPLLKDINSTQDPTGSNPTPLARVGTDVFFVATSKLYGVSLWKSDGSEEGTVPFYVPAAEDGLTINGVAASEEMLIFGRETDTHGHELWRSDGTQEGTVLLKDIRPGTAGSNPAYITEFGGAFYFSASDGIMGRELWRSDGTVEGTVLVRDIRSGSITSTPENITNVDGVAYFTCAGSTAAGIELWKSDGTEEGTVQVADIRLGGNSSAPMLLTSLGGMVLYNATDGIHGRELWRSGNDVEGATLLRDIWGGTLDSSPQQFAGLNGNLLFQAQTQFEGIEL